MDIYRTYLSLIKNSVGSKLFQNLWVDDKDILEGGDLSCAFFVSNILKILDLISEGHATVKSTVEDMKDSGWYEIDEVEIGAVLIWEEKEYSDGPHRHIGFYIGDQKAISNNEEAKTPIVHSHNYDNKRAIELILWNNKLDE